MPFGVKDEADAVVATSESDVEPMVRSSISEASEDAVSVSEVDSASRALG